MATDQKEPSYVYTDEDIDRFMEVAMRLVNEAGTMITTAIDRTVCIEIKDGMVGADGHAASVLTETDGAVEKHLVQGLKSQFSDHCFIGEEDVSAGSGEVEAFSNHPTWIIDPIDGTMNFVHKNPLVCTSVGLCINRRIVLGIVNCPLIGYTYTAKKGKGAFLNGKKVHVSGCKQMKKAMVIMEIPTGASQEKTQIAQANLALLMQNAHAIRAPGPAAMDIAFVGAGSSDAYFHFGIHCWDMAAGALIVAEAGGVVVNPDGSEFDLMGRDILVASSMELITEMVSLLKQFETTRDFKDHCPM